MNRTKKSGRFKKRQARNLYVNCCTRFEHQPPAGSVAKTPTGTIQWVVTAGDTSATLGSEPSERMYMFIFFEGTDRVQPFIRVYRGCSILGVAAFYRLSCLSTRGAQFMMRFKCASNITILLRILRARSLSFVPISERATSRGKILRLRRTW